MKSNRIVKVKTERNLNPSTDLQEDSLVLRVRINGSKIVLPVMTKEDTRHDISQARQGNR
jgi:hypothetical protein